MATDPYAGLGKPVSEKPRKDPYAGLGRSITPVAMPVPKRTLMETGAEAVENIIPSAIQFGKGFFEAVTSPVQTSMGLLDLAAGALQKGASAVLPKPVMDFIASIDNPEAAQRAADTANQFGGQMAARYGSVDRIKNTIATDPVGFAADFSTILSGGAGVAGRAGMTGTAARLTRAADVTNPMMALRPVGRGVTKIAERAPLAIANIMSPKSAAYMEAAEGRGNELIQQLRSPQNVMVLGSMPTAAEAAAPLGLTKFAAMGEAAAKAAPSEYLSRATEQEAARLAGIRSVGGTPDDLTAAIAAREAAASPLYKAAEARKFRADPKLMVLADDPYIKQAMPEAARLSQSQGITFDTNPTLYIHNVKMSLDAMLSKTGDTALARGARSQVMDVRKRLINWLENKVPEYRAARTTFAEKSKPINQMEIGQFLEGKLTSALPGVAERANVFGAAVKEAPTTIKRALTGESRYRQLTDLLEPQQVKIIEDIRDDLARKATTKVQAQKGAAAAPRVGQLAKQTGEMPQFLNRVATIANTIFNRLQGQIDRKIAIEIATEMLDPQAAAAALEKAMVREELAGMTGRGAGAVTRAAGDVLMSTPAKVGGQFQNIMTQAENRNAMVQNQFPQVNEEGAPLRSVGYATDEDGNQYAYPIYGVAPKRKR